MPSRRCKDKFLPNALSTTLPAGPNGKKAYYAAPVYPQTMHVQHWTDMLAEAGFKPSDAPKRWNEYWNNEELIATAQWPHKPDGRPMSYLATIKVAVAFSG